MVLRRYQNHCSNGSLSELRSMIEYYGIKLVERVGLNFVKTAVVADLIIAAITDAEREKFIFNSKLYFSLNPLHKASSKEILI